MNFTTCDWAELAGRSESVQHIRSSGRRNLKISKWVPQIWLLNVRVPSSSDFVRRSRCGRATVTASVSRESLDITTVPHACSLRP